MDLSPGLDEVISTYMADEMSAFIDCSLEATTLSAWRDTSKFTQYDLINSEFLVIDGKLTNPGYLRRLKLYVIVEARRSTGYDGKLTLTAAALRLYISKRFAVLEEPMICVAPISGIASESWHWDDGNGNLYGFTLITDKFRN